MSGESSVRYSICTTTYNCTHVVGRSLDSIIARAPTHQMELIVCDSKSTDGTPDVMRRYANFFKRMKILSIRCSRGRGRQIAFENSTGRYIVVVDMDTIFNGAWRSFFQWHLRHQPNFGVQTMGCGIYPRHLVEHVGGWKDLNYSEDVDFWLKLAEIRKLRWSNLVTSYNLVVLRNSEAVAENKTQLRKGLIYLMNQMALHRLTLKECVSQYGKSPFRIFYFFVAKLVSTRTRGVVDVRKYDWHEVVEQNLIKLPINGIEGRGWFWRGFVWTNEASESRDCLICAAPIPLSDKYCPRCTQVLEREKLI